MGAKRNEQTTSRWRNISLVFPSGIHFSGTETALCFFQGSLTGFSNVAVFALVWFCATGTVSRVRARNEDFQLSNRYQINWTWKVWGEQQPPCGLASHHPGIPAPSEKPLKVPRGLQEAKLKFSSNERNYTGYYHPSGHVVLILKPEENSVTLSYCMTVTRFLSSECTL